MILVNGIELKVEHFPDGTQRIIWKDETGAFGVIDPDGDYAIEWGYKKEEELSTLIYVTRHLRNLPQTKTVVLYMSYVPNARMDRVYDESEIFTLKGFADVINWLNFDRVCVLDVHSPVTNALINKVVECSPGIYINATLQKIAEENRTKETDTVVCFPDEGAMKRYKKLIPGHRVCHAEKIRDWETGKILGLNLETDGIDLTGKNILLIDDIISYGGTFYYTVQELKKYNVGKIYAFASHTENSMLDEEKGAFIKCLKDGSVERLYTTNSIFSGDLGDKIMVYDW